MTNLQNLAEDVRFEAARLAKNLTLLGCEGQVKLHERTLVELIELDALYGDGGRDVRATARVATQHKLNIAKAAVALRTTKEAK
jgi:hypothetical protein